MERRITRTVKAGNVEIGSGSKITVQSMLNALAHDIEGNVAQAVELEKAGCEIVRLTVPDIEAVKTLYAVKNAVKIPVVADIHFDYRMAIAAIDAGADKIRINPGNIGGEENVRAVVRKAAECHVPIRVGVNGGSLERDILARYGRVTARGLAESALRNVALLEKFDFDDIVISLKSSDVKINFDAYRIVNEESDYPLHIGVTEAGTPARGKIKSAAGIGALLLEGIGSTMRVSLTADPVEEIHFAKALLTSLGIREEGIQVVSCPTCGRTQVNLEKIAEEVERRAGKLMESGFAGKGIKLAVMGCAVNGPGEAREADYGVACGRGEGLLFAKGKTIKKVKEEDIAEELIRLVKNDRDS